LNRMCVQMSHFVWRVTCLSLSLPKPSWHWTKQESCTIKCLIALRWRRVYCNDRLLVTVMTRLFAVGMRMLCVYILKCIHTDWFDWWTLPSGRTHNEPNWTLLTSKRYERTSTRRQWMTLIEHTSSTHQRH